MSLIEENQMHLNKKEVMDMSAKFSLVKGYYVSGAWSEYRVAMAVEKGWITAEEYEEITGSEYTQAVGSNDTGIVAPAN